MNTKPRITSRPATTPAVPFVLIVGLFFAACTTAGDPDSRMPERATSDLFSTEQAAFMILQHPGEQQPEIRYLVRLSMNRPIDHPILLQAHFQNPEDPNRPLVKRKDVEPGTRMIELESGSVWGLRQEQAYQVRIEAFDPNGNRIGVHRQGVYSSIDTRYPDLGRGQ